MMLKVAVAKGGGQASDKGIIEGSGFKAEVTDVFKRKGTYAHKITVLEGEIKDRTLSNDECFALSKLVKIHYDIHSIEEKEIFFLGGKEAYFFFKKIGILV